jgi:hypothetical protein
MAKVYTGRDGVMQLGDPGVTLAKVVNFSLQSNLETLETTTLNEHIRSYSPGVVGYSGSATLLYYKADDGTFNTTNLLNKLYKTGTSGVSSDDIARLTFRWVDGAANNDITLNAAATFRLKLPLKIAFPA